MAALPEVRQDAYVFRHGKFDPKTGAVVPQPRQKGPTCWYYALKILRNQQEVAYPPSAEKQEQTRQFQALSSDRRKKQTAAEQNYLEETDLANQLIDSPEYRQHRLGTKAGALAMLPQLRRIAQVSSPAGQKEARRVLALLEPFTRQDETDDLREFVVRRYYLVRATIHEVFCRRLKLNPKEMITEEEWAVMKTRAGLLEAASFQMTYRNMGFQVVDWHPTAHPSVLARELQQKKCIYVKGLFGKTMYVAPPENFLAPYQGQPVFGWRPGAERRPNMPFHSIVLIGIKLNDDPRKSVVYFVDPLDGSNPRDPSQQRVYAMSYQRLITDIGDLANHNYTDKGEITYSQGIGYGLFNPALAAGPMGNVVLMPNQEDKR
jgi:hypothetical protein